MADRNLYAFGVSKSVRDNEVAQLSDREQDDFIKEVAGALVTDLREFVGDARPRSDFTFNVVGPHFDPLQGPIHVHHLSALFDVDELPNTCKAYQTWTSEDGRPRETIIIQENKTDD
jgi:hypothetical protein